MSKPPAQPELSAPETSAKRNDWLAYAILGLLAATLIVSVWSARTITSLSGQVAAAQPTEDLSNVFLTSDGWHVGQFAPTVEMQTLEGQPRSFADITAEHEVIYVAWERCPICLEHFPNLSRTAEEVGSAEASFAVVMLLSETDDEFDEVPLTPGERLASLRETHGWAFPVFAVNQSGMLELNLQGTPTTLILRRGVLGAAFASSSFERMTERILSELGR